VETRDEKLKTLGAGVRRGAYVVGYSFAIEDGPCHYVPIRHEGGDNLPIEGALSYLRDQAAAFDGTIVGANLSYDLDFLAELGVTFPRCSWFRDVLVAAPLLNELEDDYSLEAVAVRLDLPGKSEGVLAQACSAYGFRDVKKDLWRLPARFVGDYAERDARLPLQLLRRQERQIAEEDLQRVFDLESRVLPVLVRMKRRGVRIDFDQLEKIEQWSLQQEAAALEEVHRHSGVRVAVGDVWKVEPLARVLRSIGVEPPLTPKTRKDSVTAALLQSIQHDAARAILKARKVNKVRTTFAASMRRFAIGDRIHCDFNQLRKTKSDQDEDEQGTRFGRLSSSKPNLQQQPKRDALAKMWRKIFVPDTDVWACCDYSQQEPRWAVHYAEMLHLQGAEAMADRYRADPRVDNYDTMAQLITGSAPPWRPDPAQRDQYKTIFLGIMYGMGGGKMCRNLGLPSEWIENWKGQMIEIAGDEGQAIIEGFDLGMPWVRELAKRAQAKAKSVGYVITGGGRRCRFPVGEEGFDWVHKALNRVIQGTSADQMKQAMVNADAEGFPLQLQVHDELDLSVGSPTEAQALADVMREAMPAKVPFRVDVECGPSWGELQKAA